MGLREKIGKELLIFDGAMGTMLQDLGLKLGELPEVLNLTCPEKIVDIHKRYIKAGANIITTNTFGVNTIKLEKSHYELEELIHAGVNNAREAIGDKEVYIALDIGPIGEMLEPMGALSFQEAYDIFKRRIIQAVKDDVDLILIETMTDLYEVKAAVLAAKENSNLPIFATMSYEKNGRTFTGSTIQSMVMVLQGLGVDALGVNCSLGPKELKPIVEEILEISKVPVMLQANAGLPLVVDGDTIFNISPDEFASFYIELVKKGLSIIGGCCGTNDRHIDTLVKATKNLKIHKREVKNIAAICSPTKVVDFHRLRVIGERINPTGKDDFKEALLGNNMELLIKEAIAQVNAGAEILDINVGLPEIDESKAMLKVIKEIQSILDVPLQIDSTDPKVIEGALRIYNGKALVNSVNGEDKVLEEILPLVKKYGASVLGLTLDERGIAKTAEGRFKIAEKIVNRAGDYGIDKEDIIIDTLTLTAAAQQEDVKETLKALTMVKEKLGVKTVLGISNISFGLAYRELINRSFLGAALYAGLDLAIIDPLDGAMMDTIRASRVLWNQDKGASEYLKAYGNIDVKRQAQKEDKGEDKDLFDIILSGRRDEAKKATKKLLEEKEALDIINKLIVPALDLIGERYENGQVFLPQLIRSAETVKSSFEILKETMTKSSSEDISNGKIILASVNGDIHDIGKNIVKVLLESYNYQVIDLGKNVSSEVIVQAAIENDIKLVGLSALMTTTVKSMEDTIDKLKNTGLDIKVMVGGAVLNLEYSQMIKADFYAKDAKEAVEIAREVLGENQDK